MRSHSLLQKTRSGLINVGSSLSLQHVYLQFCRANSKSMRHLRYAESTHELPAEVQIVLVCGFIDEVEILRHSTVCWYMA
jgi:hypothetical protein